MSENTRNSTVAISPDDAKRLEKFCKANRITKKDFISLSLSYFESQGINPAKHETPKAEREKVTKRLDQFFAFMKKQEQDILRPMYADMTAHRKENNYYLAQLEDKTHEIYKGVRAEVKDLKPIFTKLDSLSKLTTDETARLRHGFELLLNLVDEKNKSGLMGKLFG